MDETLGAADVLHRQCQDRVVDDDDFLTDTSARLAGLPGVVAVSLGGSRAQGTHRPDSDWDLAVYYRDEFDPRTLRDVGWPGEVSEIGGWGGGVFNGGAWLQIDRRRVDVHYRDLGVVEHEIAESEHGRFHVEPLLFHLAGIPSYLIVAELALNRVMHGSLPRPDYPAALRERAAQVWWGNAELVFGYAATNHARQGRAAQCIGLLVQAATQSAHAVLAARGEWVTNEKTLLTCAGLDAVNSIVTDLTPTPAGLTGATETTRDLCATTLQSASSSH
jgi:predicted nucleotidyltransferase